MDRLSVERRDDGTHLVLRLQRMPVLALAYLCLAAIGAVSCVAIVVEDPQGAWLRAPLVLAPPVAWLLLAATWCVLGRERMVIAGGVMTHQREIGRLHGRRRRLALEQLDRVEVRPYTLKWWQAGTNPIASLLVTGLIGGSLEHAGFSFGVKLGGEDAEGLLRRLRGEASR